MVWTPGRTDCVSLMLRPLLLQWCCPLFLLQSVQPALASPQTVLPPLLKYTHVGRHFQTNPEWTQRVQRTRRGRSSSGLPRFQRGPLTGETLDQPRCSHRCESRKSAGGRLALRPSERKPPRLRSRPPPDWRRATALRRWTCVA